jgi:hypothetical protein
MINTNANNIAEALKVGNEFKRSVNDRYRLLEIDIDNIFRRLLLHAKKKYAAINMTEVDGKYVDKLEVKGLDMKRREYCALSKEASQTLLNEILSGDDPEVVLGKIHEYLRELSGKMREGTIPSHKYIIYTVSGSLLLGMVSVLTSVVEIRQESQGISKCGFYAPSTSCSTRDRERENNPGQRCHVIHRHHGR